MTINSTTPSSQTLYTVPNVYAPGLAAAGAEVCLGSVSAGGSGAGFGVSIGGTYVDTECQLRLNARTLATLGYTVAAREEMCLDPQVRAAMLAAGSPCAADMGATPRLTTRCLRNPLTLRRRCKRLRRRAAKDDTNCSAVGMKSVNKESLIKRGYTKAAGVPGCHKEYQIIGGWYDKCD